MKVKKHYEQDHVILYVTEGDLQTTITLESDRQMKRLADCLTDLYRTDGREASIGEDIGGNRCVERVEKICRETFMSNGKRALYGEEDENHLIICSVNGENKKED